MIQKACYCRLTGLMNRNKCECHFMREKKTDSDGQVRFETRARRKIMHRREREVERGETRISASSWAKVGAGALE